nr:immunoglobulin light chain junction region [Mus musculus]NSL99777.1 immunoglobulin light chain junction region [Mus musculus]
CHQRSSYPCTF